MDMSTLQKGSVKFEWAAALTTRTTFERILEDTKTKPGCVILGANAEYAFVDAEKVEQEATKTNPNDEFVRIWNLYKKAKEIPSEPYAEASDLIAVFNSGIDAPMDKIRKTGRMAPVRAWLVRRGTKSIRLINLDQDQKDITRAALS